MTDRDRLIELLKGNLPCHTNEVAFWHDEHIGALADHLIANGVTVGDANNATTTWISVEERLPTEDGRYLVVQKDSGRIRQNVHSFATNLKKVDKYDFYYKGDMSAGWYEYNDVEYYEVDDITHWMPLPPVPKGDSNE